MSILVAMIGSDACVVATDSRAIDSDGTVCDDRKKTFRLSQFDVIGGHTGLLGFRGLSVPEWLNTVRRADVKSLDDLANAVAELLSREMSLIVETDVALAYRISNVALIGRMDLGKKGEFSIRVVEMRPDAPNNVVIASVRSFPSSCTMGEPNAQESVFRLLSQIRTQSLPSKRLMNLAKSLIASGTQASGSDPELRVRSCGGRAQLVSA